MTPPLAPRRSAVDRSGSSAFELTRLMSRGLWKVARTMLTPQISVVASGVAGQTRPRVNERVRKVYARMASRYDRGIHVPERLLFPDGRAWVAARARGRILEIGVGTGLNLPLYPRDLEIAGIDISPDMVARAKQRADDGGIAADIREGDGQALPFPDASFDTVVSTLSLCTVPDERRAVAEAKRVLRSGGRFVLLEHVRSPQLIARAIERLLDPLAAWLACDHLMREPLELLRAEGFEIAELLRSRAGVIERVLAERR